MPSFQDLDFQAFPYYPALRSRDSEVGAFLALPQAYAARLLPVVSLFRVGKAVDLRPSLSKVARMLPERPFLLDADRVPVSTPRTAPPADRAAAAAYNLVLQSTADPSGGFAAWRTLVDSIPNAIPVAVVGGTAAEFILQLNSMRASKGKFAIRVPGVNANLNLVAAGMAALPDLTCAAVIVDLGDVRGRIGTAASEFVSVRASLQSALPAARFDELTFICLGTSFPMGMQPAGMSVLGIEEVDVFHAVGGFATAQYGDYGSLPVRPQVGGGLGYPKVVGPTDREWIQCRGAVIGAIADYVTCAGAVKGHPWPNIPGLWGSDRLDAAAAGNITNLGNAAAWIRVRVNIHLYRQLHRATAEASQPTSAGYDDDEDDSP